MATQRLFVKSPLQELSPPAALPSTQIIVMGMGHGISNIPPGEKHNSVIIGSFDVHQAAKAITVRITGGTAPGHAQEVCQYAKIAVGLEVNYHC